MRLGICGAPQQLETAFRLGYNYFETSAAAVAALPEEEFRAFVRLNDQLRQKLNFEGCRVCNGLFPAGMMLVGSEACPEKIAAYLENLFGRLQLLGIQTVIFGSGAARRCPEGFPKDQALQQLKQTAQLVGDWAFKIDCLATMEHLNRQETNLLTSFAETLAFVREIQHPQLAMMVDFYHLEQEKEPLSSVYAPVGHCHIAGAGRKAVTAQDLPALKEIGALLAKVSYGGRISMEAVVTDFEPQAKEALPVLQTAFAGVWSH